MISSREHFESLIARLESEARVRPQLVQASVELTYGCNLRCVHCYNPTHIAKNELSTDQVFRILDGLAAQGCLWVYFTGGELFTRRDVFEIFEYAKSLGLVISIFTNATLITPKRADQIKALNPYSLSLSIYGATAETYERITKVRGSFEKFVRGVDLLLERNIRIVLKLPLMTLNVHEAEAMKDFARSRGVRYKVYTEIQPKVDGSKEPLAYRISPEQEFEIWRDGGGKRILEEMSSSSSETEPQEQENEQCGATTPLFDCACGKSSAAVTPYGKMNLCLSTYTPQYDLTTGTVAEGWEKLVDLVASIKPGPEYECGECNLYKRCNRGTRNGWTEQGKFDGPCIPHFREVAQKKVEFLAAGLK